MSCGENDMVDLERPLPLLAMKKRGSSLLALSGAKMRKVDEGDGNLHRSRAHR